MARLSSKRKVRRSFDRVGYPMEVFEVSKTKQSFVGESDINNLMKRYRATGLMRQFPGQPRFMDCTSLPADYQDALNKVVEANRAFEMLSSDVRSQFDNEPAAFVAFASDPENLEQMREWKLAPPAAVKPATLDDVVDVLKTSTKAPVAKGDDKGAVSS